MNSSLQPCTAMWDCGMTPTAGCKRVFSSALYSIYSVDRASDLVWENLLLVPQRDKIHNHHYWSLSAYTIGFACKYASYCDTSKILFRWLQFRWDYKHHHIISRVVLGFSSFTVLSLGSITSLTLLSRAVHVELCSFSPFARSASFRLDVFWEVSAHSSPLRFSVWRCLVGALLKWLTWLLSWLACGSLQVYKAVPSPWV